MNLPKAIQILSNHGLKPVNTTWGEYLEALKLGIEALKAIERHRKTELQARWLVLPGETEE